MILGEGFPVTLTSAGITFDFKIDDLTPFGLESGEKIRRTTHDNVAFHTYVPPTLGDVDAMQLTVRWDPECYASIVTDLWKKNKLYTVGFPDDSTGAVWGFLRSFKPQRQKYNQESLADIVIEITNLNGSSVETGPAYTAPAP